MRVCILYSGGKDSNLALLKAWKEMEVVCLVSLSPKSEESVLFHYPNTELVKLQAKSLKIPLIMKACSDDEVGSLNALREALKEAKELYGVEGVVTGAIRSTYQATRFQRICDDLELWCFNPLWLRDEVSILREALELGFEIVFTRIAGYPLSKDMLGRKITIETVEMLENMKRFVNPAGEGGEYETLVLNMPLFTKRLKIVDYEIVGSEYDATLIVKKAELVET
ncbi:diphthine--ammonia ligase [Archaeoglobus profundus]|uniref:ATP binding protein n=1 Tax=Archaeoglobus profundus (strain DSM 5631 / JCM 9629 / NBRC 100127 / Av18) TaxID=572546 RepID=D2RHG7_ARCPA|nr:diphthine--ammonia ligase [Archaeoglobus profundus]ADB57742.1 ATP binding protein [Archaeoglobus profundus DSM 5631]